jgi:hypothetical protein
MEWSVSFSQFGALVDRARVMHMTREFVGVPGYVRAQACVMFGYFWQFCLPPT